MTHPLRWLALIALDTPEMPAEQEIRESLDRQFPKAGPLVATESTNSLITGTLEQYTVAAALVPRPIPWPQLEGPCDTAWYWPQAADTLRNHGAHLLVTLVDEGGKSVDKSIHLTQWVTALTTAFFPPNSQATSRATPLGIFWGPGRLIHPRQAFVDQALQMTRSNLPLYLWIDFRIETIPADRPPDGDSLRLYTTGLEALGQTELEVSEHRGNPQQLLEFVYNVAHYLLAQRKIVNDGDTIGLTDQVQATIHQGKSMLDGTTDVLCLEFQTQ